MEEKMAFVDHLDELRRRLIFCFIAAFGGMILAYAVYDPWILDLIKGPIDSLVPGTDNPFVFENPLLKLLGIQSGRAGQQALDLHLINPMEGFMVKVKASFFGGVILGGPVIFYQLWKFVSAGLSDRERRSVRSSLPVSLGLFLLGILVAYVGMLPVALYFLVVVTARELVPMLSLSGYVSMVVASCLAFGVIFEMPIVMFVLARLGIVSPGFLKKQRKYAILLMFIVAAVLTPPDVVTQAMMALPLLVLYEGSIIVSQIGWARNRRESEA